MSPSRPWKMGRSGSRSNRSTSSTPRSLVSMITGIWRSRAASRTRNFMSSESHSSDRKDGSIGFEVESFDVEHAAVARLHDHRYLALTGRFTHEELHVE